MAGFKQMAPHRHVQTKAQNKAAFKLWLTGCTDEALFRADPGSLARSYGLSPTDVAADIVRQASDRRAARG